MLLIGYPGYKVAFYSSINDKHKRKACSVVVGLCCGTGILDLALLVSICLSFIETSDCKLFKSKKTDENCSL